MKNFKFVVFLVLLIMVLITTNSCDNNNNNNNNNNNLPLVGKFSWNEWKSKVPWEDLSANDYTPNPEIIKELKILLLNQNIRFILFTSSWCPDCKSQTPRMIKVLSESNYDIFKLDIYGLDYKKQEPSGTWEKYNIKRVPTLLVLEDEIEKGRIIEYPQKSIEEDILDFFSLNKIDLNK